MPGEYIVVVQDEVLPEIRRRVRIDNNPKLSLFITMDFD